MNKLLRRVAAIWLALGVPLGIHAVVALVASMTSPVHDEWAWRSQLILGAWLGISITAMVLYLVGSLALIIWSAE